MTQTLFLHLGSSSVNIHSATDHLTPMVPLSLPPPIVTPTAIDTHPQPKVRRTHRGKRRGGVKRNGGIRGGLFKQFGKPFWDIMATLTDEEYAGLSQHQKDYIDARRNKLKADSEDGSNDGHPEEEALAIQM
jgi:hypothetical protein